MPMRKLIFSLYLMVLIITGNSCGNNPKPDKNLETELMEDTVSVTAPIQDTAVSTLSQDSTSPPENLSKNKVADAPPPKYSEIPGPVGFVSEDNLVLYSKSSAKSVKLGTLKLNETIYILETIMVDESGAQTQYPTWYRIQRQNKERGWVKASAVSSGH